jgi:lipoprotein-anchoring transpeptidase ErfK/SrfK
MSTIRATALGAALLCLAVSSRVHAADTRDAQPAPLTVEAINAAEFAGGTPDEDARDPLVARLQVLLDRAHMSPGVIDGLWGDNVRKALAAYEESRGLPADGTLDAEAWRMLTHAQPAAFAVYTVTAEDVAGPFVAAIPEDFAAQAEMERLAYTGVDEMLAERFHVDLKLFRELNPKATALTAGDQVVVAAVARPEPAGKAARLTVSRERGALRALDGDGRLLAFYPASVGSDEVPSPSGTHRIVAVVPDPDYTYRPAVNFQQGQNTRNLILPPGPNGPVGTVWIDLDKPTYGIHGTPEPSPVGKHYSHGCVRLTNWDAEALAALVEPGVPVTFED